MRINPLGVFPQAVTMHYFYALGQPLSLQYVTPTSSRIYEVVFTSPFSASNNVVCGQIDVVGAKFVDNSGLSYFTHYSCFGFNSNNQVISGEISFRHLGTKSDQPYNLPVAQENFLIGAIASALCAKIQQYCVGANQQYSSVATCEAYVGSLNVVSWDKGNQNNIPCVSLHTILIPMFPDVHCRHTGPDPGNPMCTAAHTYMTDYTTFPTSFLVDVDPVY
jgi:hypothetical protein